MIAFKKPALVLVLWAAMGSALRAGERVPTKAEMERAVAAIAGYDAGKPRRVLFEIEAIIRKAAAQPELEQHLTRQLVKLLNTNVGHDAKLFICQQLWIIGSDAAMSTLQRMLLDEKTAHMACYALGREPNPRADEALRGAMAKAKGMALVTLIGHIGERRDSAAVGAIAKRASSREEGVAEAALAALGKIATEQAAGALKQARARGDATLRGIADNACLQCAQRLAEGGKTDAAKAIYRELLASARGRHVRRGALLGLIGVSGQDAVPLILSTLRGKDPLMKAAVIASISTLEGKDVSRRFAAQLPKSPPAVQVLLIGALVDRGGREALPAIAAAARGADAEVRAAAVAGLGKVGDASAVRVLARALADGKSAAEKSAARASLVRLGGKGVNAAIIQSMSEAAVAARPELIGVLLDRNVTAASSALLEQAAGKDAKVRRAAFKALGRLAGAAALPAMLDLLAKMEGDAGRREAERAIVSVARKIIEPARADPALLALSRAKSTAAKGSLLRILRGIGDAKAFEAVRAALKDAAPAVRDAAVRALADWPDARATDALLDVFRTTKSDVHRVVALRGCVRLLGLGARRSAEDRLKVYGQLMAAAARPAEKKLVLSGLAMAQHPAALKIAASCLSDPRVRAEAELAIVGIGRAIGGAYPEETRAAMRKFLATSKNAALRKQAAAIVRLTRTLGDFLTAWQVAGPYFETGVDARQLFDRALLPETGGDVAWNPLPLGPDPRRPYIFDLLAACGGEQRAAYARTWVHSERPQPARLEVGSDDGHKVWFNAKVVLANNVGGACKPGQYKANVTLRKGWNTVLVKITQFTGPWQFCARLAKRDGGRLEGLKMRATPPPK